MFRDLWLTLAWRHEPDTLFSRGVFTTKRLFDKYDVEFDNDVKMAMILAGRYVPACMLPEGPVTEHSYEEFKEAFVIMAAVGAASEHMEAKGQDVKTHAIYRLLSDRLKRREILNTSLAQEIDLIVGRRKPKSSWFKDRVRDTTLAFTAYRAGEANKFQRCVVERVLPHVLKDD